MGLTIDEARTQLAERYLQDPDKNRDDNTDLDAALASNVISTLGWFIDEGGLLYSEILDLTTTTSGTLDLSSYNPLMIHGVSYKGESGEYYRPMVEQQLFAVRRIIQRAQDLRLVITRTPATSGWSTGSNAFIPDASAGATSFASSILPFEHLCIVNAALEIAAGDDDRKGALRALKADLESKVAKMRRPGQSSSPQGGRYNRRFEYAYAYRPDTQTLMLTT